jgi:hypothetical protein
LKFIDFGFKYLFLKIKPMTKNEFRDKMEKLDPNDVVEFGNHEFVEETKIRILFEQGDFENYKVQLLNLDSEEELTNEEKNEVISKLKELSGNDLYDFFNTFAYPSSIIDEFLEYEEEDFEKILSEV